MKYLVNIKGIIESSSTYCAVLSPEQVQQNFKFFLSGFFIQFSHGKDETEVLIITAGYGTRTNDLWCDRIHSTIVCTSNNLQ